MSDHRPPDARQTHGQTPSQPVILPDVSITEQGDSAQQADDDVVPADAATLGFADLAEHAPGVGLAEFRDLRSRLFGDIDTAEPAFEESEVEQHPPAEEESRNAFVPMHLSIAHGAVTAAEIAAANEEFGDAEVPEEDEYEVDVGGEDLDSDPTETSGELAEVSTTPGARSAPIAVPFVAPDEVIPDSGGPEPSPPAISPPAATINDLSTTTAPLETAPLEEEQTHRNAPIFATLATVVVAAVVGGWILLWGGDDSEKTSPSAGGGVQASQDTRAQGSTSIEIDGDSLRASEQLTFAQKVSQITLSLPRRPVGTAAADFEPQVSDVEVSVPGQPTRRLATEIAAGSRIIVDLDSPSDTIELSYLAEGAVLRTEPSSAHRAKALVTPLRIVVDEGSTRILVVKGPDVLNLGCTPPGRSMQACGDRIEAGWEVAPETPDTDVIAQVDLPE
jgi:hypothetical protein